MSCIRSAVLACCFTSPLTVVVSLTSLGSMSVSTDGPSGQNVSKPLARDHWPSLACRSRAVTSLAQVYPKITSGTLAAGTSRHSRRLRAGLAGMLGVIPADRDYLARKRRRQQVDVGQLVPHAGELDVLSPWAERMPGDLGNNQAVGVMIVH